jgi:hypothetical protein
MRLSAAAARLEPFNLSLNHLDVGASQLSFLLRRQAVGAYVRRNDARPRLALEQDAALGVRIV